MYNPQTWENEPSKASSLSAQRFNHMEEGIADAHEQLDGRLSEAALSATIAGAIEDVASPATDFRSRTIILGDSIAIGSDTATLVDSEGSWFSATAIASKQRMYAQRNAGVAGNTTTQMLARVQTDVIAHDPTICVFAGNTNDYQVGISTATQRANYQAVYDALRAAKIQMVVTTCTPIDVAGAAPWTSVTLRRQGVIEHNVWLKRWAAENGVPVIDLWAATADIATGGWLAGYSDDGVHPNYVGRWQIAAKIAPLLPSVFQGAAPLVQSAVDPTDLLTGRGLFLGTTAPAYPSANWFKSGDAAVTVEEDAAIVGKWLKVTGGTTGNTQVALAATVKAASGKFAAGDVVEFSGRIEKNNAANAHVSLRSIPSYPVVVGMTKGARTLEGIFSGRGVVPAGATELTVIVLADPGATIRVAQLTLRNLTQLGLV